MRASEGKDFLVESVADQARLESIPLSDLEKRMMYFTESEDAVENPIELNEEFEQQHDTTEFELKIARLLNHAYRRLQRDSPSSAKTWDAAIRELRKGDHYVLVMWDLRNSCERPPPDSWKLLGASLLVASTAIALAFVPDRYSPHWHLWQTGPATHTTLPKWFQRSILAALLAGYVYYALLPALLNRPAMALAKLLMKILRPNSRDESAPK